jgi:cytochrome c2
MPRGVLLLAGLLLLGVATALAAIGLLVPPQRDSASELGQLVGGDPERGKDALRRNGCVACHSIPGMPAANGLVGPPLDHFARRGYVGGVLPNTPENLVAWILDPQKIDPLTAMPATGISESEARDAAAYLYTLN